MDSNFWSAIVGALVGGAVSFGVQWANWTRERHLRDADRDDVRRSLGLALLFKTVRITSNLKQLSEYIDERLALGERLEHSQPWSLVVPIASLPPTVTFTADEMALVLGWGDNELFAKLVDIDGAHNGILGAMATYAIDREKLANRLTVEKSEGLAATTILTADEMAHLGPIMAGLNDLLEKVHVQMRDDHKISQNAMFRLHERLQEHLGIKQSLHIKPARRVPEPSPSADSA